MHNCLTQYKLLMMMMTTTTTTMMMIHLSLSLAYSTTYTLYTLSYPDERPRAFHLYRLRYFVVILFLCNSVSNISVKKSASRNLRNRYATTRRLRL